MASLSDHEHVSEANRERWLRRRFWGIVYAFFPVSSPLFPSFPSLYPRARVRMSRLRMVGRRNGLFVFFLRMTEAMGVVDGRIGRRLLITFLHLSYSFFTFVSSLLPYPSPFDFIFVVFFIFALLLIRSTSPLPKGSPNYQVLRNCWTFHCGAPLFV